MKSLNDDVLQIEEEEFDNNLTKEIDPAQLLYPIKIYGVASTVDGRWVCVTGSLGKSQKMKLRQNHRDEPDLEFAQDTLKKVLAQDGVRY